MSNMVIGDYTAAVTIDGSTHYLLIQPGSASTAYKKINRSVFLGVSGQPVDISTAQTLTNKVIGITNTVTVADNLFTIQDNSDNTKQAQFQLSGITTGTTRTYTLPNASSTLADIATAQTFTNKTLTSPTINGGTIDNATITVDSIAGHTDSDSGTVYGISVTNGAIQSNTAIKDGIILPKSLLTGTGSSWTWPSWTPVWTNLTVGNGTVTANYIQVGKTVKFSILLTLGSTSSVGSGVSVVPPVTPKSSYITGSSLSGYGMTPGFVTLKDDSASAIFYGPAALKSTSVLEIDVWLTSGTYLQVGSISSTVPFSWNTGDSIGIFGEYEAT